jgi:hypothetical protein
LAIRLPVAAILVVVAARLDRPWILAPAVTLALPLLWAHGFAVLVAITPLLRVRSGEVRARTQSRAPVLEPS